MTQEAMNNAIVLYELAIDRGQVEASQHILELVPELSKILMSPVIAREKKNNIIDNVFLSADCPKKLVNFLKVMCEHNEIDEIEAIYTAYYDYWDEKNNRKRVKCTFAEKVDQEKMKEIQKFLEKKYPGKELIFETGIDPDILGGVVVQIGYKEYDWSFKDKMKQLEKVIKG